MYRIYVYVSIIVTFIIMYIAFSAGSHTRPDIGEHTVDVLKELKYTDKQIKELLENRTVYQCDSEAKL